MTTNLDIKINHSPNDFCKIIDELSHKLQSYKDRKISLFGAGKNGQFIATALYSAGIKIHKIYDDSKESKTKIYQNEVLNTPNFFENSEVVILTLSPRHIAFERCLQKLQTKGEVLILEEPIQVKPQLQDPTSNPIEHSLNDYNLAQYRDNRILKYKDKHKGETCVIIGNGPSLNDTDFSLLEGLTTFALNKAHLLYERKKFTPDYLCCYIKDVISQCKDELIKHKHIPTFISHESMDIIPPNHEHIHHLGPHKRFTFSQNPSEEICAGFTVTYVAMQLAAYMGFSKIILIGVDHNFGNFGKEGDKWLKIDQPRNTHFDPAYFDKGQFWQTPNYQMIEAHFAFAKEACSHLGIEIVDATVNGQLKIFPKVNLSSAETHLQDITNE